MERFDTRASNIQLAAVKRSLITRLGRDEDPEVIFREEPIPFRHHAWRSYQASEPFDMVCLARSPEFTPSESDKLFDEIRVRFIDEDAQPAGS